MVEGVQVYGWIWQGGLVSTRYVMQKEHIIFGTMGGVQLGLNTIHFVIYSFCKPQLGKTLLDDIVFLGKHSEVLKSLNLFFWGKISVWDKYKFFGRMNIRINLPQKKSTNIFANEYIRPKYSNVFEYNIICPRFFQDNFGHFYILCYFGPILNHFGTIITSFNNFWETMKIQI